MIRSRVTNMQHGGQRSLPDAETADTCSDAEFEKRGGNVHNPAGKGTILRMYSASAEASSR